MEEGTRAGTGSFFKKSFVGSTSGISTVDGVADIDITDVFSGEEHDWEPAEPGATELGRSSAVQGVSSGRTRTE